MNRTKLADRTLPTYTQGEELFNMISHIVGGAFGVTVLALCCVVASLHRNYWGLAGGVVYCLGMIFFVLGIRHKFCHSVFHLFILAGSVLQFIGIFRYCIL